jgi:hypothetical protein
MPMLITLTFGAGSSAAAAEGADDAAVGTAEAVSTGAGALAVAEGAASTRGDAASVVCGGTDSDGCFEHADEKRTRRSHAGRITSETTIASRCA